MNMLDKKLQNKTFNHKKYMICQKYQQNVTINDIKQHKKRINIIIWVTIVKIIAIVTRLC